MYVVYYYAILPLENSNTCPDKCNNTTGQNNTESLNDDIRSKLTFSARFNFGNLSFRFLEVREEYFMGS